MQKTKNNMPDSNFGAIPSNTTLATSQSVRRNATNDAYKAYTPGAGGGAVATDVIFDAVGDLAVGTGVGQ